MRVSSVVTCNLCFQAKLIVQSSNYDSLYFRERKTKSDWLPSVSSDARLKDTDIDTFVQCLLPLLKMAMFSKVGTIDAASTYHNLALVRPEMVLPDLLNR